MGTCARTACWFALLTLLVLDPGCRPPAPGRPEKLIPPVANIIPDTLEMHGIRWIDPYSWMKDVPRDKPETIAYAEAENAYTEAVMRHTEEAQTRLFEEMKARIQQTDLSVPAREGDYFLYSRTEEGKNYPIFCRKKGNLEAPEEVTLDVNVLAEGKGFYEVRVVDYSPDHRYLAFSADTTGAERYTLHVKDLTTGEVLPDAVYPARSVAWANDNRTLFYTRVQDEDKESPSQAFRHALGTAQQDDALIYQEDDLAFGLGLITPRSMKHIYLVAASNETYEWRFLPANDPAGEFRMIKPREAGVEYSVADWGNEFFIITNQAGAPNFKIMRTPADRPEPENWTEFIGHRDSVYITGFDAFRDWVAVHERTQGLEKIRVINMVSGDEHHVSFPDPTYYFEADKNPNFESDTYRIVYASLVTPRSVYDYHFPARNLELLKRTKVMGGFDPANYTSEYLMATARDGAKVPLSVVYRKDLFRHDGTNPLYLYAYGSYGIGSPATFSSVRLSLLDRGFIYAIAHIRGGDELGKSWHDQGKVLQKKNTFHDFIDCAEHLIKIGYTTPKRLVVNGGSAGGMLMGVVANLRPDLFAVVLPDVPAVDEFHHMLDPTLPGVEYHYTEWGNPNIKEEFDYFRSWDVYQNVRPQAYPAMLVTAGLHDPRVPYWEPVKYVAKLRATRIGDSPLLLKTNMSGHMGASGRYDAIKEIAFQFAFILDQLGIRV